MPLTLNNLLSRRLHLPSFLLPLMVLSVTFTSKPILPDLALHQLFSSLLIICAILVYYRSCRKNIFMLFIIPVIVVLLRIARFLYADGSGILEIIYFIPYSIIFLVVGAKMVRDYPLLMLRQIKWLCIINIILSLMQIMGVQWAQYITNYYWIIGGSNVPSLFVNYTDLTISPIQIRPSGFSSANNVMSQYLLFFYAFSLLSFINEKKIHGSPIKWMFIISFACALTGAKIVLLGIILINIIAFFVVNRVKKFHLFRVYFATFLGFFCYWIFFPGMFIYNYNLDLFSFRILLTLASIMMLVDIPYGDIAYSFVSNYNTGDFIGFRSVITTLDSHEGDFTNFSGLGAIIEYLPIIIFVFFLLMPFWLVCLSKLNENFHFMDIKKVPIIMLVTSIISLGGGPFLFTSYFWFFFSFAMYPLSVLLLRSFRVESLVHSIPRNSFSRSIA